MEDFRKMLDEVMTATAAGNGGKGNLGTLEAEFALTRLDDGTLDANVLLGNGTEFRNRAIEALRAWTDEEIDRDEVSRALHEILEGIERKKREETVAAIVPPLYLWQNHPFTQAQDRLYKAILKGSCGVIIGPNGTGKTALGWDCITRAILDGRQARLICAFELFEDFRLMMKTERGLAAGILDGYVCGLDLLVIDEIDKSYSSNAERNNLAYLIGQRCDYLRQTVIIGNCTDAGELRDCIGQSVMDRLTGGNGFFAEMNGKSFRQQRREGR